MSFKAIDSSLMPGQLQFRTSSRFVTCIRIGFGYGPTSKRLDIALAPKLFLYHLIEEKSISNSLCKGASGANDSSFLPHIDSK